MTRIPAQPGTAILPAGQWSAQRPLLSRDQAGQLTVLFKVLANETRLRLLHAIIRAGELRVTDLATRIGMKPQAVSNQLKRLSDLGILNWRRDGNYICYQLADVRVRTLFDQGLNLMDETAQHRRGRAGRGS